MNKEFKKYVTKYGNGWKIAIIAIAFAVFSCLMPCLVSGASDMWPMLVVVALALLIVILIPALLTRKYRKELMADPSYPELVSDFENSVALIDGKVRLGETAIFIKHSTKILKYSEITQVYQYIHKTNGVEDKRALKYVNQKGKHRVLCALKLRDNSQAEMLQIVEAIVNKNPGVKIGYR